MSDLNTKDLDKLIKALSYDLPGVKAGIFGAQSAREEGETTNAEVGAKHEYGLDGMPVRSFLRMPITLHLFDRLEQSGAFTEEVLRRVFYEGSIVPWMQKVGIVVEGIILEAFDTGGFGQWKRSVMSAKKNKQTLVETAQLRNSITVEVD